VRVGVYIDGFNLYYGAKSWCGAGTPGWRWLDIRALIASELSAHWPTATISRLVYCTARVSGVDDPTSPQDQDRYLRALDLSGTVDRIEYGKFIAQVKTSPLATWTAKGRPLITTSNWPIMVKDASRTDVPDARFLASHLHREEKGSDVNVATHLLIDVFAQAVDCAVIVSNDSDLALPIEVARSKVPTGVINPGKRQTAGDLRCDPNYGVGSHWFGRFDETAYKSHQLPDPVGMVSKPAGW
jgi:uncharacterized LabA/DUF88 family protein